MQLDDQTRDAGPFSELFSEAERQLNICNSCRYCAGYCPVWPALELRTELSRADMTHLANLCHDCQDCFTACMYTPPHEFDVNPPRIFAELREHTYDMYIWPGRRPGFLAGRGGVLLSVVAVALLLTVISLLTVGSDIWTTAGDGSPYAVIGHWLLVGVAAAPFLYSVAVMLWAGWRYWRSIGRQPRELLDGRAWIRGLGAAAVLRHQSGGDEGCNYPADQPSGARKIHHQLVMYGFLLTVVSTTSAAFLENVMGQFPPYPYLSVPVVTGTVGGVLATIGAIGLLVLKKRARAIRTTESMKDADTALIWALLVLMVSGLAVLIGRTTVLFAPMLVLHLGAVLVAFAIAPYTKFVHWVFRLLSMVANEREVMRRDVATV